MGMRQSSAVSIAAMVEGGASEARAAGVLKTSYMTCSSNNVFVAAALAKASASTMLARGVLATVMPRKCVLALLKAVRYLTSSEF
ncbi:hypothetical protein E2562_026142 [Oryza meyeriana var. granulata]|uniref:Uncharacterized protein n=1 Tax=Oryza meyeriana var. granulata TaxID=110450 RepID=A0A6G1FCV7_9ORYZ|nr:hypothetical protein E2562_026142 [Oryza meyeriana var. granulata]